VSLSFSSYAAFSPRGFRCKGFLIKRRAEEFPYKH